MFGRSQRIVVCFAMIAIGSLLFGVYEILVQGIQISKEQVQLRQLWSLLAGIIILSLTSYKLGNRELKRLIIGLDIEGLPNRDQIASLKKIEGNSDAEWIADMTNSLLHSGFCTSNVGKANNAISLTSGVTSAVCLGFTVFNPITGWVALVGIGTGAVSLGSLIKELFSVKRFKYWDETGERIKSKWRPFTPKP